MTPSIVEGIFQLFPACEINYGWAKRERRRHFDAIVEGGIRFRHAKNPFGGSADEIFRNDVAR